MKLVYTWPLIYILCFTTALVQPPLIGSSKSKCLRTPPSFSRAQYLLRSHIGKIPSCPIQTTASPLPLFMPLMTIAEYTFKRPLKPLRIGELVLVSNKEKELVYGLVKEINNEKANVSVVVNYANMDIQTYSQTELARLVPPKVLNHKLLKSFKNIKDPTSVEQLSND